MVHASTNKILQMTFRGYISTTSGDSKGLLDFTPQVGQKTLLQKISYGNTVDRNRRECREEIKRQGVATLLISIVEIAISFFAACGLLQLTV
jgi:hypothetical protein